MATAAKYYTLRRSIVRKVPLTHPIMVSGEEVDELWFERPKLKHLRGVDLSKGLAEPEKLQSVIAGVAGIAEDEAGELDYEDLQAVSEVIVGFFFGSPQDGSDSP